MEIRLTADEVLAMIRESFTVNAPPGFAKEIPEYRWDGYQSHGVVISYDLKPAFEANKAIGDER